MNRMPCHISDSDTAIEDADMLPEISDDDRRWILDTITADDWRNHFNGETDLDVAWEFYYETNAEDMDALTFEAARNSRNETSEAIRDIGSTNLYAALGRRQAN